MNPERPREKILWQGRPSRWGNFEWAVAAILLCWTIVVPIIWICHDLATRFTKYTLTDERLRIESGILTRRLSELELYRVKDTSLSASLVERIVGLGTVTIVSSDRTTPRLRLPAIPAASRVRELIRDHAERRRAAVHVREVDLGGPSTTG